MNIKFPFKFSKVAALIMLTPLGGAHAAAPVFLESSVLNRAENLPVDTQIETGFQPLFNATTYDSRHSSMVVDEENNLYVAFSETSNHLPELVKYNNGSTIAIGDVDTTPTDLDSTRPQIFAHPLVDNGLVAAYRQGDTIVVNTSDDGGVTWNIPSAMPVYTDTSPFTDSSDSSGGAINNFKAAIDSKGKLYVVYTNGSSSNSYMHVASYNTLKNEWVDEIESVYKTDGKGAASGSLVIDISIDSNDYPYVGFRGRDFGSRITIATPRPILLDEATDTYSSGWNEFEADGGFTVSHITYLSIGLDHNDDLYLFSARNSANLEGSLFKVTDYSIDSVQLTLDRIGHNLAPELTTADSTDGHYPEFFTKPVFDSNNTPYIAFSDAFQDTISRDRGLVIASMAEDGTWSNMEHSVDDIIGHTHVEIDGEITAYTPYANKVNAISMVIDNFDRPVVSFNYDGLGINTMRLNRSAAANGLSATINEGDVFVTPLTAFDDDGDAITFTITDDLSGDLAGSAAALFMVDETVNELKFIEPTAAIGADEVFNLTVTASAGGESTSTDVQVTLVNINGLDYDGDGFEDDVDFVPFDATKWTDPAIDYDSDGIENDVDPDIDNDEVLNEDDALDYDENNWTDLDGDGFGDQTDDAFPQDASEQVDSDGDGLGDVADPAPNYAVDITAPQFTIAGEIITEDNIVPLNVDATNILTDISESIQLHFADIDFSATDKIKSYDTREESTDIAITGDLIIESGVNALLLSTADVEGNARQFQMPVYVHPIVEIAASGAVEVGGILSVLVKFSGDVAIYPVALDYEVTTMGMTSSHTLMIEDAETAPAIEYQLTSEVDGESIFIEVVHATNAAVLRNAETGEPDTTMTALVVGDNVAPIVSVVVSQKALEVESEEPTETEIEIEEQIVSTIAGGAGNVTVTVNVSDPNVNDTHCITYEDVYGLLTEIVEDSEDSSRDCYTATSYTFSPETLLSTTYPLNINVADSEGLSVDMSLLLEVDEELNDLALATDSDGDGIPNLILLDQGDDDDTNDLIEELDNNSDTSRLTLSYDDGRELSVGAGLTLSLGTIASSENSSGATLSSNLLEEDPHYSRVSEITNFTIEGLSMGGESASVVVPLADNISVPADAIYRKYSEGKGWFDFVEDDKNAIASTVKDDLGLCPLASSTSYTAGLTEGDTCIRLTIEDGGENDADETINGVVEDPGVLATLNVNSAPVITVSDHTAVSGMSFSLNAYISDAEGDDITYLWEQTDGPSASIEDADSSLGMFVAPEVTVETELTFMLTVSDGQASDSESFTVTVTANYELPSNDVERNSGQFGWMMMLIALGGILLRKTKK